MRHFLRSFFCAATMAGMILAAAPLKITTTSLPNGTVGAAYSATLSASGGKKPYSWSIAAGSLPDALSLNSGTGQISGTPSAAGAFSFTAQVTDNNEGSDLQPLQIAIGAAPAPPALSITTTSLPNGTMGVAYSAALAATGGTGGYTWGVASGSLPAGLTLSASGAIGGTPTASGTANFTAKVTDSSNNTTTKALAITIAAPALVITTSSLPNGAVGAAYSATLTATGGAGGNTWSVAAGSLPAGLTMNGSGTIAGTPTTPGTANFTAQVRDSAGTTANQALSITVAPPALVITTSSLPNGVAGTAYSAALTATGGAGGNTWSVAAGSLPAGVAMNAAGTIAGTPTTPGTANFTAQVRDSAGTTANQALSITVAPPALVITTSSLPNGVAGTAYSAALTATGGAGGNTWSVAAGALPAGVAMNAAGTIAGTPTTPGTANFTAQVKDSAGATATKALSIAIAAPALTITTTSLPSGTIAIGYSQTLAASGGVGGNSWSLAAGSLPLGLALSPDGTIAGTPLLPGTANFTVVVRDAAGTIASKSLTLTITALAIVITTPSLATAEQGVAYSQALSATGGTGNYQWSITAGSLPAGLALDPAGRISGTPAGGSSTFTVQASDNSGGTASKQFTLTVIPGPAFAAPGALPSGALGAQYSATASVKGGQAPYTITLATGQLPPGLSLNASTGEISGKPSQAGNFAFTLQARDTAGAQTQSNFTITIAAGLTITTAPALAAAAISTPYQATLGAAGGVAPYTWSATAGSLPPGLTLHANGTIDGTPTAAGPFGFTAAATDANGARATKDFTITVAAGLTITTAPQLPGAVPGAPYSATLAAAGGRAPYTWSVSAGALPPGFSLNAGTGAIAGTTSAVGNYSFTAKVADSAGVTAEKAFTLAVAPGLTFTNPASLPDAVAGHPYSYTLAAAGGKPPYSWRIADGALPAGVALNAVTGVISGTPTATGTFNFTVVVSDTTNLNGTQVHTLVVGLSAFPTFSLAGMPGTLAPLQQPTVDLALSAGYGVAITGRLTLTFTPASGMPDDPAVQFSSGGRSVAFTIPASATHATFSPTHVAVQSGSVAGTIAFRVESLQAGGSSVPAPGSPVATAQVSAAAPAVRSVTVSKTSSGFTVQVVGLSDTRELASATVRFHPSSGSTLTTAEATVPLADAAKAWFQSSGSGSYGGQFTLTLPFTINGSVSLDSLGVVLTNSAGSSAEATAPY